MKKSRRIILLISIFTVCICFAFMYSLHAQRSAFRQSKAEILISAGYDPHSNVIVWRENGHYYVNGQRNTDPEINSAIDSLIEQNEDYNMIHIYILVVGSLILMLFVTMYHRVVEIEEFNKSLKLQVLSQEDKLNSMAEHSTLFLEQEVIRRKRSEVEIYDYAKDKAYPLEHSNSEESELETEKSDETGSVSESESESE